MRVVCNPHCRCGEIGLVIDRGIWWAQKYSPIKKSLPDLYLQAGSAVDNCASLMATGGALV